MSQYVTGVNYNSATGFYEVSTQDSSGNVTTKSMNFSTLCMMFSLDSLNAQDEVFATQFAEAEGQVNQLTMINDCMQMLNKYSTLFEDDDGETLVFEGNIPIDDDLAHAQKMLDKGQVYERYVPYAGEDGVFTQEEYNRMYQAVAADNGYGYAEVNGQPMMYEKGSDMALWVEVYYPSLVEAGIVESTIGIDCCFTEEELSNTLKNLETAQSTVSSQNEQQMLLTNDAANKRSTILQQAQTLLQAAQDARNAAAKT